jgi:mycothiol synthase
VITVAFRVELSANERAELEAMIADAAAYDEEAGFSSAAPASSADANREVFQAVARLNPGLHGSPESPLVAFLRLDVDRAGGADAQLLVHREYRSLGIATLMLELLSEREGDGWAGTGAVSISGWARGSHPAAERMARRLGADVEGSTLKLMRGDEVRLVDADDEAAVLTARHEGFVHEHTDVRYVWRVPVPASS